MFLAWNCIDQPVGHWRCPTHCRSQDCATSESYHQQRCGHHGKLHEGHIVKDQMLFIPWITYVW